jgi:hypothetical protein
LVKTVALDDNCCAANGKRLALFLSFRVVSVFRGSGPYRGLAYRDAYRYDPAMLLTRARAFKRSAIFAVMVSLLLTGCRHSTSTLATLPPEIRNANLLYLQPEPHRSLYVEVDAVKGAEPSESELGKLRAFLNQWCEKPDGITIMRSSGIPRSEARGNSALSLARRYLDGPVWESNSEPAYLYVLYYDNRVNRNPAGSPRAAAHRPPKDMVPINLAKAENPYVLMFPYPAMIFLDRSWLGGLLPNKYQDDCSIHEAGHVLGLVSRVSQIKDGHCPTTWCCMASVSENIRSDVLSWLKREKAKPGFCEGCAAELRQARGSVSGVALRFAGPVLVRTMQSYQVLSLPGLCGLYIVDSLETELPKFIEEFRSRNGLVSRQEELWFSGYAKTEKGREFVLSAIAEAKQDVVPEIRKVALQLESALHSEMDEERCDEERKEFLE